MNGHKLKRKPFNELFAKLEKHKEHVTNMHEAILQADNCVLL